jgi:hypothetical protein
MFSIGLPGSGKVILKNLAVSGSDWFALAKPLNCDTVEVVVAFDFRFCDDPAKSHPIYEGVMSRPMKNSRSLHATPQVFLIPSTKNAPRRGRNTYLENIALAFLSG